MGTEPDNPHPPPDKERSDSADARPSSQTGPPPDPQTAAMLHRVPLRLWQNLDAEQRELLLGVLNAQKTTHVVDYRVSIDTIFWGRCYLAVFAGPERRHRNRLAAEGQTALPRQAGLLIGLVGLLVTYALFGAIAFAYLLKSALGIDLSDEASFLHPLYELFFGHG